MLQNYSYGWLPESTPPSGTPGKGSGNLTPTTTNNNNSSSTSSTSSTNSMPAPTTNTIPLLLDWRDGQTYMQVELLVCLMMKLKNFTRKPIEQEL